MTKRPLLLMGILLVLLGYYLFEHRYQFLSGSLGFAGAQQERLPGQDSVSKLKVSQLPNGHWVASFDYYYTGPFGAGTIRIDQSNSKEGAGQPVTKTTIGAQIARRGSNHLEIELMRPREEQVRITREVAAVLTVGANVVSASQKSVGDIEWPTYELMWINEMVARGTPAQVVDAQARKINTGRQAELVEARNVLEQLLKKHPDTDGAYIELARVAMKTNWGPEGLAQAEGLLDSARQIRPDNPDMTILLGYVYAHQKRYKEAEALFSSLSQTETSNLWLWANWGELLEMQGKPTAAADKYKAVLARPPSDGTHDSARRWTYGRLIDIAQERGDLDAAESLYKQRTTDYGLNDCHGPAYARFMLYQRMNAPAALALAEKLADVRCPANDLNEIIGVANYILWAGGKDPERAEALRQARVRYPAGPQLFLRLASADTTLEVARKLVAAGDKVDQVDNLHFTALGYALQEKNLPAARRLLRIGARPAAGVGPDEMPAALIPVVARDFEGIKLMQRAGVDYSKIRYRGLTALDHARSMQDRQLLDALEAKGKSV
jgi:tetratricopeptide (TPR) repeat protein